MKISAAFTTWLRYSTLQQFYLCQLGTTTEDYQPCFITEEFTVEESK